VSEPVTFPTPPYFKGRGEGRRGSSGS